MGNDDTREGGYLLSLRVLKTRIGAAELGVRFKDSKLKVLEGRAYFMFLGTLLLIPHRNKIILGHMVCRSHLVSYCNSQKESTSNSDFRSTVWLDNFQFSIYIFCISSRQYNESLEEPISETRSRLIQYYNHERFSMLTRCKPPSGGGFAVRTFSIPTLHYLPFSSSGTT